MSETELIEITEEFDDICNPDTFTKIIDTLRYYEAQGDMRAIPLFRSLRQEAIQKCGVVIRSLDKKLYNGQAKEKKYTMRGLEVFEIGQDGKLSLPEPRPKTKIADPIPECMLMLYKHEQERKKKE